MRKADYISVARAIARVGYESQRQPVCRELIREFQAENTRFDAMLFALSCGCSKLAEELAKGKARAQPETQQSNSGDQS